MVGSLMAVAAFAQAQNASMTGSVGDLLEAPVPQAGVTLTNPLTGATLHSTTNQAGEYASGQVAPGRYDLSVRADGFKLYTRRNIEIGGAATLRMDVTLEREKDDLAPVGDLEKLVAAKPEDYLAQLNLGRAYLAKGNTEKALRQFEAALKLRPDYAAAALGLAQLALRRGAAAEALQYAQEVIKLKPDSASATVLAAMAYMRLGQLDVAADLLDKLLKNAPNDSEALYQLGVVNLSRKRYPEAETAFWRTYTLDPSTLRGLVGVAAVQFSMNEPEKAVQTVAAEVEKDPQRIDLRKELANAEFRAKQYDKAIADYQAILDKYKDAPQDQADVYDRIGGAYLNQGDLPRAVENLKKAVQLAPDKVVYITTLASACDASGNSKEALAYYREALKVDPENAIAMNNAAYVIAKSGGDLDEALRLVLGARRQLPNMSEVLDTLGWVYLKMKLVDSACQVFQDLVEKAPTNPMFHYHYALALAQKGDKDEALKQLNLALQNNPGKEEEAQIRELIKKLS